MSHRLSTNKDLSCIQLTCRETGLVEVTVDYDWLEEHKPHTGQFSAIYDYYLEVKRRGEL